MSVIHSEIIKHGDAMVTYFRASDCSIYYPAARFKFAPLAKMQAVQLNFRSNLYIFSSRVINLS